MICPDESSSTSAEVLAILADGMGGEADGEKASQSIVRSFSCAYAEEFSSRHDNGRRLETALKRANADLALLKRDQSVAQGAGATLIALSILQDGLGWVSVGDSLLYHQRGEEITKVNNAHTWEWELQRRVASGRMTASEAAADKGPRHALYAAVCGESIPAADLVKLVPCQVGDRFIIASDGLQPLIDKGWESILNNEQLRKAPPSQVRDTLLKELKKIDYRHQDNATVIVVDILPHADACTNCSAVSLLGDRPSQQDTEACWQSPSATLAVVADGAGGHAGGEFASSTVVRFLHEAWNRSLAGGVPQKLAQDVICDALADAHSYLIDRAGGKSSLSGKSTVVAVYISHGTYTVVNIGDSRAYLAYKGKWKQLSIDDSLLRVNLERGEISPEEARNHPDQSRLLQAIGGHSVPQPHVFSGPYSEKSSFLLCCDGLWGQLPPELWEMSCWAASSPRAYSRCLENMARAAVEEAAGKSDNVSAIWIHPELPGAHIVKPHRIWGWVMLSALVVFALLITALAFDSCEARKKAEAAETAQKQAESERDGANKKAEEAQKAQKKAESERDDANAKATAAQTAQKEAENQRDDANARAAAEQEARKKAEARQAAAQEQLNNAKKAAAKQPTTEKCNPDAHPAKAKPQSRTAEKGKSGLEARLADAVEKGDTKTAELLIKEGADVNAAVGGNTLLGQCAYKGDVRMTKCLLAASGIDVNRDCGDGSTPLWRAVSQGHIDVVKELLGAKGIDVNRTITDLGATPLFTAAANGKTEMVRLLLAAPGIEPNKMVGDVTPLKIAEEKNHADCATLIRAAGGQ